MIASSWLPAPLLRQAATWLAQLAGDGGGEGDDGDADVTVEAAADAVDAAATFAVDGELCVVARLIATMMPIKADRPISTLRALRFLGRRLRWV